MAKHSTSKTRLDSRFQQESTIDSGVDRKSKRINRYSIDQLHNQLKRNQLQRTQPRDYRKILSESRVPVNWYKNPTTSRPLYINDQNEQLTSRTKWFPSVNHRSYPHNLNSNYILPLIQPTPSHTLPTGQHTELSQSFLNQIQRQAHLLTPRTRYMLNLYNTAVNYDRKQHPTSTNDSNVSSNSKSNSSTIASQTTSRKTVIPSLPTIASTKQSTNLSLSSLECDDSVDHEESTLSKQHSYLVQQRQSHIVIPSFM